MLASHARLLEVIVKDTRVANIDLPNGNRIGSERFAHKLAWWWTRTSHLAATSGLTKTWPRSTLIFAYWPATRQRCSHFPCR